MVHSARLQAHGTARGELEKKPGDRSKGVGTLRKPASMAASFADSSPAQIPGDVASHPPVVEAMLGDPDSFC
jgi:hypothetical protein